DVRSFPQHPRARGSRRVSGSNPDSNLRKLVALGAETLAQLPQRTIQIALDVVVQRFERGYVKKMHRVGERFLCSARDQLIELPQKSGESLSRSRRGEDERMPATGNGRPSFLLWIARVPECLLEPLADERM